MPQKLRKASGQAKVTIKCLFMFKYYALLKVNTKLHKKKFQGCTRDLTSRSLFLCAWLTELNV